MLKALFSKVSCRAHHIESTRRMGSEIALVAEGLFSSRSFLDTE